MKRETASREGLFDSIYLHNLPNNAHGEFNHDVATRARETQAIVTNLSTQLAAYEAAVGNETEASYKDLTDSITELINNELAPARDKIETGLKSAFRAQMESDDAEVAAAASTLFELAHLHRLHTDMKLDAQTDAIRDFISDVETNHAEELQATGYQALFLKLKAANDAVCDAMMQRIDIEAERVTGAMVEARRATDEAYRNLLRGVDAYAYVQGADGYVAFAKFVNQLIKHYKRIYPSAGSQSSSNRPGLEDSEQPAWPVIPEGTTEEFGVMFLDEDDSPLYEALLPYGATVMAPEPPTGMRWPLNTPSTMPYGSITVAPVPLDTPTEPLYKFEYRDGDTVLRTDMLPANSVIIYYPAPDGKQWAHQPQGFLTPAEDWYVEAVSD